MNCFEPFSNMRGDYGGHGCYHPGLRGRLHEAFDDAFVASLEAWHYALQYALISNAYSPDPMPAECLVTMRAKGDDHPEATLAAARAAILTL